MFVELTAKISEDCPILSWANAQENPYLAMGHVGTHLDCYEKTEIPLSYCVSEAVLFDVRAVEEITEKEVDWSESTKEILCCWEPGAYREASVQMSASRKDVCTPPCGRCFL